MACLQNKFEEEEEEEEAFTIDGSVDWRGRRAVRAKSGTWIAGILILLNQGLATLAFFGIGVNLVLCLTRVLDQTNADAANNVSRWTGTVYLFSFVGAFLSDSYWGRYKTCVVFQVIFVLGLGSLSVSYLFLIRPIDCGKETIQCWEHSRMEIAMFYISIYLIALGYGGYQPNIVTFGADQFDGEHSKERNLKVAFFSYFYLAMNLGSLFSNTVLGYFEDGGLWEVGFWVSTGAAFAALILFLVETPRYRHLQLRGNPFSRFCQVLVAASLKCRLKVPPNGVGLYGMDDNKDSNHNGKRKVLHTHGFRCLNKAAVVSTRDLEDKINVGTYNRWRLCSITQVEEVKCLFRLIPIWLCTIMYSVVFTQMASLFVEQGAAMKTRVSNFRIPPASMSSFDILSVTFVIFLYRRFINPLIQRLEPFGSRGLTELLRMGIGLVISVMAMVSAGIVECFRLKYAEQGFRSSSLSIFWQVPQYTMIGASEVFMYVGQLEFFNAQTPDGLKSIGSALCMTSMSLGNYVSNLIVSIVMSITSDENKPGWIPENLNKGHLDRFYFLLAVLTTLDLVVYIACAKWYSGIHLQGNSEVTDEPDNFQV